MSVKLAGLASLGIALVLLRPTQAGCRTYSPIEATQTKLVQTPETGDQAQAEIGDTMVNFVSESSTPAIRTTQDVTVREAPGVQVTVQAGFQSIIGQDDEGKFYEHVGPIKVRSLGVDLDERGGFFVPDDPAKPMSVYTYGPFGLNMTKTERVPFDQTTYVAPGTVRFRIEFIYTGCVGNIVTATYREFTDDMARPAFTQDLKYDITSDKVIGFRGARIQVLSATNTTITYVVQKGFTALVQ